MTALAVTLDLSADAPRPRRRRRTKRAVPAKTLGTRVSLAQRVAILANGLPADDGRPKTRADCANVPRPCPFVTCKHSLYADVNRHGGLKLNMPDLEPDQMPPEWSCALDVADRGGATLEEVAAALNITREGVRLIEVRAFDTLGRVHLRVLKGLIR